MTPTLTIHAGNSLESLRKMADNSVHCVVTSPPYWNLRDYKIPPSEWPAIMLVAMVGLPPIAIPGECCVLGMERDPLAFVAHMTLIFEEVRRVLRPDGNLWLNFGDSHSNVGSGSPQAGILALSDKCSPRKNPRARHKYKDDITHQRKRIPAGFKKKDLIGMPWRIAFALQAAGWYLRMDNIWNKPNPLPESVPDRTTKCHEYLFHFTKRPSYFYDAEAIKEPASSNSHARTRKDRGSVKSMPDDMRHGIRPNGVNPKARLTDMASALKSRQNASFAAATTQMLSTRNKRSVWTITTAPFKGAHFATYPPDLVRPCIRAGSSAGGCCSACGAPLKRLMEKGEVDLAHQRACGGDANGKYVGKSKKDYNQSKAQDASATKARILAGMVGKRTIGWAPTCKCEADVVPCTVLDPFGGAFTTAFVAMQEGRHAVMLEINPEYIAIGEARCKDVQPYQEKPKKRIRIPTEQLTLLT